MHAPASNKPASDTDRRVLSVPHQIEVAKNRQDVFKELRDFGTTLHSLVKSISQNETPISVLLDLLLPLKTRKQGRPPGARNRSYLT